MRITGSLLEYFLFIEGVRVPLSSLQVSVSVNAGARLHATIPPLPQGLLLVRGMKVALFKKQDNDKPFLRFHGLLITKNYSKIMGERHLSIDCASVDCRWATMICSEVNRNSFTATVVSSTLRSPKTDKEVSNAKKEFKEKRDKYLEALNEYASSDSAENLKKSQDAMAEAKKAQKDYIDKQQQEATTKAINAASAQFIASSTRLRGYTAPSVMLSATRNQQADMSREFIKDSERSYTTIYGVFQRALAGIDAGKNITTAEGEPNPLSAFKEVLATAYENSDDYLKREYEQLHVYQQMYAMPVFRTDQFKIYAYENTKTDTKEMKPSEQQGTEYNFGQAILRMAEDMIGQQHASFPLYGLISKMMDMFFCKVSVDPLKVDRSICFHPEMTSCIPPKCNVLFPNMYNGISLNFNAWTEPTRSIVSYPPALERPSVLMNPEAELSDPNVAMASSAAYIADTTDPFLAQTTALLFHEDSYSKDEPKKGDALKNAITEAIENSEKAFNVLTEEEAMCGVVPNVAQIPFYPLSFASVEVQASLANFIHSMSKFGTRSCTVTCSLTDDMAVGMPILLVDDVFSIHGILENYTYSVTPDGQVGCQASIAYPKMIFNGMDTIPQPPTWINADNISVENIGPMVYQELFGCGSIYDDENVTFDGVNEITYKTAKLTAAIVNRYNKAPDKLLFVNDYRSRKSHISMEDYFQNIYECTPEFQTWDSSAIKVWKAATTGGVFAPYNGGNGKDSVGEVNADGVTMLHTTIDKQKIVLDYVQAVYRGTVSGLIGGILVEDGRDEDLVVSPREDIPDMGVASGVENYSATNTDTSSTPSTSSGFAEGKIPWKKIMKKRTTVLVKGGHISSAFGPRNYAKSPTHHGVDIGGDPGMQITSATSGIVVRMGYQNPKNYGEGYGLRLYIKTGKLVYIYAHLRTIKPNITVGTQVTKGQVIAELGNTGRSSSPHLHFEINDGKRCYSPLSVLWELEPEVHAALTKAEVNEESPTSYNHAVSF